MKQADLKLHDPEKSKLHSLAKVIVQNGRPDPDAVSIEQQREMLNRAIDRLVICSVYAASNDGAGPDTAQNVLPPDPVSARTSWAGSVYTITFRGKAFVLIPNTKAERYIGEDGIVRYTRYATRGYRKGRIRVNADTREAKIDDPYNVFGVAPGSF